MAGARLAINATVAIPATFTAEQETLLITSMALDGEDCAGPGGPR